MIIIKKQFFNFVAPYVGAWIETFRSMNGTPLARMSHPMWVRGLKLPCSHWAVTLTEVAPYVGAWIETEHPYIVKDVKAVAPYVGAWIETYL